MTDRYVALTVTLDRMTREDDAENIIAAIRMISGVQDVVPVQTDANTYWAKETARRELVSVLWDALKKEEG